MRARLSPFTSNRHRIRSGIQLGLVLSLLLSLFTMTAAADGPAARKASATQAATKTSSFPAPGADVLNLEISKHYKLHRDGSWNMRLTVKRRILTYKGKKEYADFKFNYNQAFQQVKLLSAATIKPDGQRLTVSKREVHDIPAPWNSDAALYSRARQLVVNLPAVEPGCITEVSIESDSRMGFWSCEYFRLEQPIQKKEVSISVPAGQELYFTPPSQVKLHASRSRDKNGNTIYRWQGQKIPASIPERGAPDMTEQGFCLLAGTFADNQAVAAFFRKGFPGFPPPGDTPEANPATAASPRKKTAGQNPADALFRELCDQTTLYPISFLETDLQVQPPELTAQKGYGRDADLCLLFYQRLRRHHLPARILLASPTDQFPEQCPKPAWPGWWEDILIESGGSFFAFGNEKPAPGITGYDGCPALDLASGKLLTICDRTASVTRTELHLNSNLQPNRIDGRLRLSLYGSAATSQRYTWRNLSPDEKKIAASQILHGLNPRASFTAPLKLKNLQDDSLPLVFTCRFTVPEPFALDPLTAKGPRRYRLPLSCTSSVTGLQSLLSRRTQPLAFSGNFQEERLVTLKLPPGCRPTLTPPDLETQLPLCCFFQQTTWNEKDHTITWRQNFTKKRGIMPPAPDYSRFIATIRRLTDNENCFIEFAH